MARGLIHMTPVKDEKVSRFNRQAEYELICRTWWCTMSWLLDSMVRFVFPMYRYSDRRDPGPIILDFAY